MTRKSRVNTKAVPDSLKPKDPATLADHMEPPLSVLTDREYEAAHISDEVKGGLESVTRGDATISGDHLRRMSPKDLRQLVSSASKALDSTQDESVSPGKGIRTALTIKALEIMQEHAKAINQLIDKATQTHLEIAKACLKARNEVGRQTGDSEFLPLLRMSSVEFSKYCAIGKKSLLHDPAIHKHLPTSFSSLYVISMLDDDALRKAIDEKRITPQSTRAELEKLIPTKERNEGKEIRSLPGSWFAAIELDPTCDGTARQDLHDALIKLKSSNPAIVRVVDQIDLHEAERRRQAERKRQDLLKQIRVLARKDIKHAGKTTRKGIHKKDEAKIGNDADEARIRQALLVAGREGKYDELVEQAKRELIEIDSAPPDDPTLQNA